MLWDMQSPSTYIGQYGKGTLPLLTAFSPGSIWKALIPATPTMFCCRGTLPLPDSLTLKMWFELELQVPLVYESTSCTDQRSFQPELG